MTRTRATALACALAAFAALAPPAQGRNTQEIGAPGGLQFPKPDCPKNAADPNDTKGCQVIAEVTGFNVRLNGVHNPMRLRRSGYIVAFTVALAKPDTVQTDFFKTHFGSKPTARLSVVQSLHDQAKYKLVAQTQAFDLEPFLGSTPTIALRKPFRVHKDDIVALTVPTWLPAFAHNLDSEEIWRSSHETADCSVPEPTAAPHEQIGTDKKYECVYRTARMLYTATFIGDPTPTNVASKR
jgi:hypothetical protein